MRVISAISAFSLFATPVAAQTFSSATEREPLKAIIWPGAFPSREAEFVVNRPAYVAVFEIVPERGAGLLYPSAGWHAPQVQAGPHAVILTEHSHRWFYLWPMLGSPFAPSRYLLLVASDAPLRLDEIASSPSGLSDELGVQFASAGALGTISRILAIVAPEDERADWTYDVFVDGVAPGLEPRRYVRLQCGHRTVSVPLEALTRILDACHRETRLRTDDASASERRDWTEFKDPRKSEPGAREWPTAERKKVPARAWSRADERSATTARERRREMEARWSHGAWDRWTDVRSHIHRAARTGSAIDRSIEKSKGPTLDPKARESVKPDREPR